MFNDISRLRAIREDFKVPAPPPLDWADLHETPRPAVVDSAVRVNVEPLPRRHRATAVAAAVLVLAGGSFIAARELTGQNSGSASPSNQPSSAPSNPSTPASPASLDSLATAAENSGTPGEGDVRYLRLVAWVPGGNLSSSSHEIQQSTSEIWITADGSGLVSSNPPGGNIGISDGKYGPDTPLTDWPECRAGTVQSTRPSDPAEAAKLGYPSPAAEWMLTVASCAQEAGPIPGPAQAALLRELAATDGIEERGQVSDKLGRTGYGFATQRSNDYGDEELEIILDPSDGSVLAFQILLVKAEVTFPLPAINQYIAYEESSMVPAIGDRP